MPTKTLLALALVAAILVPAALVPAGPAAAATPQPQPKVSYTQMLYDFMCLACHESLAVAQSPESYSERQYLRTLISQGKTKKQIEQAMVAAYSPAVLASPPAHGFSLVVYVLPPVLVVLAIAGLALTLPKWRRRARLSAVQNPPPTAPLAPADAERLSKDLARHP